MFALPLAKNLCSLARQWSDAFLPALSPAADMSPDTEVDIRPPQADELGHSQSGLHSQKQDGMVAAAEPSVSIRCGQERVDLLGGEEGDYSPLISLGRDGEDPLDQRGLLGVPQHEESE